MSADIGKVQRELESIKSRLQEMEDKFDLLIEEKYAVRDEYVEKIKRILREGEFEEFKTIGELKKSIEQ
jgi:spore coat polysaccharide biosynthesis predicted glycosyltransferase SpsG